MMSSPQCTKCHKKLQEHNYKEYTIRCGHCNTANVVTVHITFSVKRVVELHANVGNPSTYGEGKRALLLNPIPQSMGSEGT